MEIWSFKYIVVTFGTSYIVMVHANFISCKYMYVPYKIAITSAI